MGVNDRNASARNYASQAQNQAMQNFQQFQRNNHWPRMGENGNVYFAPVSSDPLSLYMASTMVATRPARVLCFAQRARYRKRRMS